MFRQIKKALSWVDDHYMYFFEGEKGPLILMIIGATLFFIYLGYGSNCKNNFIEEIVIKPVEKAQTLSERLIVIDNYINNYRKISANQCKFFGITPLLPPSDSSVVESLISRSIANTEPLIIKILDSQENTDEAKKVAKILLNSGNNELIEAGEKWAYNNGYQVKSFRSSKRFSPEWR